jgi:3-hydroxyisobutyrate dehydrogenase-like beta-hydroxyacid dehydrogenase
VPVTTLAVAILGVGEAGACFADDLAAPGVDVRTWDPDPRRPGNAPSPELATAGADVVLSLNSAAAALDAALSVASVLRRGQLYADLNSAAPRLKRELAALIEPTGALFADVALLTPVPGNGLRTPALASGSGAAELARLLGPLGMPVETLDGGPGAAAERKLLRSVFMKGLAAAVIESLDAARAAGAEAWLRSEIADVIDAAVVDRLVAGSRRHAARRVHEMRAACELLTELGVEPRVAAAAVAQLEELAKGAGATE